MGAKIGPALSTHLFMYRPQTCTYSPEWKAEIQMHASRAHRHNREGSMIIVLNVCGILHGCAEVVISM